MVHEAPTRAWTRDPHFITTTTSKIITPEHLVPSPFFFFFFLRGHRVTDVKISLRTTTILFLSLVEDRKFMLGLGDLQDFSSAAWPPKVTKF